MPLEQQATASERAYLWTKQKILSGALAGGELISEGEVASALALSRTPVREAFLRLEVEGLLRLYPKRGALVVPVSAQEISDVLEARLLIERFAAQKVLQGGKNSDVAMEMRTILDSQAALLEESRGDQLSELDREFHGSMVAAAQNSIVSGLYASLRDRQLRISTMVFEREPSRRPAILAQHGLICDHLESGDSGSLMLALEAHIHGAHDAGQKLSRGFEGSTADPQDSTGK